MYYIINCTESANMVGIDNAIKRAFEHIERDNPDGLGVWLDVRPYTEKGKPSSRFKKFTIHINIRRGSDKTIFIYGDDSVSRRVYNYIDYVYESGYRGIYAKVYYI